jgi:phosphopantothenoylcysteine decarboxylase/phosphopantothenate--cysteine ligase
VNLNGKKILLGICGSIAAYKACELVRLFIKNGAEVRVIMTPSALNFVSPITLSTLSQNEVVVNMFPDTTESTRQSFEQKTWHIYNGLWADIFVIAPATANTIAKIRHGIADNFLTAAVLSSRAPIAIFPAMDEDMYQNNITENNISFLKEQGFLIFEPETGELASGLSGIGRLPEPENIYSVVKNILFDFHKDLISKKILVTAGPTYELIDDVRFIGNFSSGKMGFSLANAASQRGADVTLISGPSSLATPRNVNRINVLTSDEMFNKVSENFIDKDAVIMAAAVADYKPKQKFLGKIKKNSENLIIETSQTIDILQYLGKHKHNFKLAGFALETDNEIRNAQEKLINKNLDLIVINNPNDTGAGFNIDTNLVTIIKKNMEIKKYPLMSKFNIANIILDEIFKN